jgi:hypothetical protein
MTIFGIQEIDTFKESGVTLDEYVRFLGAQCSSLAEYIGWDCKLRFEKDWLYLTVVHRDKNGESPHF